MPVQKWILVILKFKGNQNKEYKQKDLTEQK